MTTEKPANLSRILELVKHLLDKTTENGCTEAEAESAAAKASDLLFKHNLSLDQVDASTNNEPEIEFEQFDTGKKSGPQANWRVALMYHIARFNFCSSVQYHGSGRLALFGEKQNVEVVKYVWTYLERELSRRAYEEYHVRWVAAHGAIESGPSWQNSFYRGAIQSITKRMREQFEANRKATEQSTALVVVKDAAVQAKLHEVFPKLSKGSGYTLTSSAGFDVGKAVGASIGLHAGVKSGGANKQIR